MTSEKFSLINKVQAVSNQLNSLLKELADNNIYINLSVINDTASARDIRTLKPIFFEEPS